MAKRGKKKKIAQGDDLTPEETAILGDEVQDTSDDVTYTMGDIKVADADGDVEAEEFKKTAEIMNRDSDGDGEDDWVEEYNTKDEDDFLDMADEYDIDNPYNDDYY